MSFYVKKEHNYGDKGLVLLQWILSNNYDIEIVKRLRDANDIFISIIRDVRKPKYEQEMYHIYKR